MKIAKFILLICCVTIWSNSLAQNDSAKIASVEQRLRYLEDYKANIDNYSKVETHKAVEAAKMQIDDEYKNVRNIFLIILGLGIPATLYGIYMMFWGMNKKIKTAINERIETIVEQKREEIIKLVSNQEFETRLKAQKKILVISANESSQEEVKHTMSKFKFKNVIYRVNGSFDEFPDHDLIVFNNADGDLSQQNIKDIITSNTDEDACFVAYTTKQLDRNPRLNFANSKFTLYHSLLTTLSYVESIKIES